MRRPRCVLRHRFEPMKWGADAHGEGLDARRCSRCERLEVWAFGQWVKVKRGEEDSWRARPAG